MHKPDPGELRGLPNGGGVRLALLLIVGFSAAAWAETVLVIPDGYYRWGYVNPNPQVFDRNFFATPNNEEFTTGRNGQRRYYGTPKKVDEVWEKSIDEVNARNNKN